MKRDRGISEPFRPAVNSLCALLLLLLIAGSVPSSEGRSDSMKSGVGELGPGNGAGQSPGHRAGRGARRLPFRRQAREGFPDAREGDRTGPPPGRVGQDRLATARRRPGEEERHRHRRLDGRTRPRGPAREDGREAAEFLFEPQTVPGDYYFYYLPYRSEGRKNYPNVKYDPPEWSADPGLAARAAGLYSSDSAAAAGASEGLLRAEVIEFQSADAFSAFTPMERIATAAETTALLAAHPGAPYLLFPEDRSLSIRMTGDIPGRWAASGPSGAFRGRAARGEYFAYQIGLWAARHAVSDLDVRVLRPRPIRRRSRERRRRAGHDDPRQGHDLLQRGRRRLGRDPSREGRVRRFGPGPGPLVRRPGPGRRPPGLSTRGPRPSRPRACRRRSSGSSSASPTRSSRTTGIRIPTG